MSKEIEASAENLRDEIEQCVAILATLTSPTSAAKDLRRMALELESLQPQAN